MHSRMRRHTFVSSTQLAIARQTSSNQYLELRTIQSAGETEIGVGRLGLTCSYSVLFSQRLQLTYQTSSPIDDGSEHIENKCLDVLHSTRIVLFTFVTLGVRKYRKRKLVEEVVSRLRAVLSLR